MTGAEEREKRQGRKRGEVKSIGREGGGGIRNDAGKKSREWMDERATK